MKEKYKVEFLFFIFCFKFFILYFQSSNFKQMIKEFFIKQMANQALKDAPIPADQKEKMIEMICKNPELFQKIAEESQSLMKEKNMDQMTAVMQVAGKYQNELKNLLGK